MRYGIIAVAIQLLASNIIIAQRTTPDSVKSLLNTFDSIYYRVNKNYVRPVALEDFSRKGIDAMYASLDPFSFFMSREEAKQFHEDMSATFGGTGLVIRDIDGKIIISETFKDKPAERAGLKPSDQILTIDADSTSKLGLDGSFSKLRGEPGTKVVLTIRRSRPDSGFAVTIIREVIKISSVPYYGMLDAQTGYIRFSYVTEKCSDDVLQAFTELKRNPGLKSFVFDLRGNIGGYFKEATRIANFFLGKGTALVKVGSRNGDTVYYANDNPVDTLLPMVILINEMTASSAEILTGAIQDNDRAVVIGQKSFGKGLVGQIYSLGNGMETVLTTGLYYTPSGRCIQSKKNWKEFPGTNKSGMVFRTRNGRIMKEEDGIQPDVETVAPGSTPLLNCLLENNSIFKFASKYHLDHPSIPAARNFVLPVKDFADFRSGVDEKKCEQPFASEQKLQELKKLAESEGWSSQQVYSSIERAIAEKKKDAWVDQQKAIRFALEQEIVFHYYGRIGRFELQLKHDEEVKKAIEVLKDLNRYKKLLNPQ